MIKNKNHIKHQVLHFKRWSHKSYAVFNSLGRVVRIGFLATIIKKLVTVKALVFEGLLILANELEKPEEDNSEFLTQLEVAPIGISEFIQPSTSTPSDQSGLGFFSYINTKNKLQAFLRPFLMSEILPGKGSIYRLLTNYLIKKQSL